MAYQATVIPVMIASPGDVLEYRLIARDVIHEWNYIHSMRSNAVLMPVGWETHSSPELGASAQELINDRVLEDCDLLIGIFWTRLGTPTGQAASGTVEEIRRHVEAGKPAMVYFSTAPAALATVNEHQYAALQEFRSWCQTNGIIETLDNAVDFRGKLGRHLQIAIQKSSYLSNIFPKSEVNANVGSNVRDSSASDDPLAVLALGLSEEAESLLLEAASDKNGLIFQHDTFGGKFIQTNGKTLGDPVERRSAARWEYALDQLVSADLVKPRGTRNEVFELSEPGYQLADYLNRNKD